MRRNYSVINSAYWVAALSFHLFDYEIFPLALFGAFLGGDMFVWSTMATKVKVTKTMLNTLD